MHDLGVTHECVTPYYISTGCKYNREREDRCALAPKEFVANDGARRATYVSPIEIR